MSENCRLKCEYLQQEVESLKQQLKDAVLVNDLNKRALAVCYNPNNFQTDNESKAAVFLLQHIMEENGILRKQIDTIRNERNHAFDKALLNEQLTEAHQKQEKQSFEDLHEKIEELKGKIKEKDQIIGNLQSNKRDEGLIYIDKEIVSISDIANKFNTKMQHQNIALIKYYNQIKELQDQKDDLAKLNFTLSNEILKLRTQRTTPKGSNNHFCKQLIFCQIFPKVSANQDPNFYLQKLVRLQKRVLLDESDDESKDIQYNSAIFSPLFSPLPMKVKQHKQKRQTFEIANLDPDVNIPKLKLDKAKQIQEYNIKRLQQLQAIKLTQNYDAVELEEKLSKLTHDLINTRNKYHAQLVYNQQLEFSLNEFQRVYKDCLAVNEALIRSIKGYEEKWKQIFYQHNFYKNFYLQYKDFIQSSFPLTGKVSQPVQDSIPYNSYKDEQQHMSMNICDLEKIFSNSRRMGGDRSSHQAFPKDFSMMNSPEEFQTLSRVPSQRNDDETQHSQTNYKQLLISFAKDIYQIFQSSKIPQNRVTEHRFRRSYSNTLDYVI